MARTMLTGSARAPMAGASDTGPADPGERLEISVLVRHRQREAFHDLASQLRSGAASPRLTREEFVAQFGSADEDVAAVRAFAEDHGLEVMQVEPARRTVKLGGTLAQFEAAFGVTLRRFAYAGGEYRGRTGSISLPAELQDVVVAVLGLDNRPQARPHFRLRRSTTSAAAATPSYTPAQVAALYGFPTGVTGEGECVAIIELGGGYDPSDLDAYFQANGVNPAPTIVSVPVDSAANAPTGSADGPDGEVALDIEVVGVIAPRATIAVYFAPNTDQGFIDAVTTAVHDTTHKPSVISISWGGPESTWTQQSLTALDAAFQAAAALGVTVCVASGDNGSSDGVGDGADHVDFPASSPHALACGGTRLVAADGAISAETVWNDGAKGGAGGGGVSTVFAAPAFQTGLSATRAGGAASPLTMRGVPDVAGDADPQTGYQVRIDGQDTVIGGTSAVAPLWSALIALINQSRGSSVGYLQPQLYAAPGAFNDVTRGDNGDFEATAGWDACTGLGSPKGVAIAALLARNDEIH
jgi:kumamolisin